jgi:hypothetical protein
MITTKMSLEPDCGDFISAGELIAFLEKVPEGARIKMHGSSVRLVAYDSEDKSVDMSLTHAIHFT